MNETYKIRADEIIRSARKTVSLEVTPAARLILRAPFSVSQAQLDDFLFRHKNWIEKKLESVRRAIEEKREETLYYLGNRYHIKLDSEQEEPFKFNSLFSFSEKFYKHRRDILISWLAARAHEYIRPRLNEIAAENQISYKSFSINTAAKRWGSCSSTRKLNFSYRLIMARPEAVKYVLIHELAHLREMNHSVNFWKEVSKMMPGYREEEKYLRLNYQKFIFQGICNRRLKVNR